MGVSLKKNEADNQSIISVSGAFTVALRTQFLRVVESLPSDHREVIIDLTETDSIDASAMGLLMVLRRQHPATEKVILLAPNSPLADLLRMADFHLLFDLETAV